MKKVLVITYYWPPCGGVAVQRWLKISKYLSMFEWLPTIITTENGDYPYIDQTLLKEIPNELKIIRTKTPSFTSIFKFFAGKNEPLPFGHLNTNKKDSFLKRIMFFIRSQLICPDARVIWNKRAFKAAEKAIFNGLYEAVITTGPPHSTHLIGLQLKKKYNLKWIADFRDPWTNIYYYQMQKRNFLINAIDKNLEKKVLTHADAVVTVSQQILKLLPSGNKFVIPNSYDPDDYVHADYHKCDVFRVKFIGAMTPSRKEIVFSFMKMLSESSFGKKIEISLIGSGLTEDISKEYKNLLIRDTNFLSHKEVIQECVDSEILLLAINKTSHNEGILTYKLFEYIGAKTSILGIGPTDGDASKIIDETKSGKMFDYNDYTGMQNFVDNIYKNWKNDKLFKIFNDLTKYSAPYIASQFAELLSDSIRGKYVKK